MSGDAFDGRAGRRIGDGAAGHPCFDPAARSEAARVHIPVAPRCNMQCLYCDRGSDCPNESRPGLSSAILPWRAAGEYVGEIMKRIPDLRVVGIAGPGDPFANPEETLGAFEAVRRAHPGLILCAATNGLAAAPYADGMAALGLSHLTVTMNALSPATGAGIYAWIRDGKRSRNGEEGASILIERQLACIEAYASRGIIVKVNFVLVPVLNGAEAGGVAREAKARGASFMNVMPLRPVPGTVLGHLGEPGPEDLKAARKAAAEYLSVLSHCGRCRADAAGRIGAASPDWLPDLLASYSSLPVVEEGRRVGVSEARPYVAVATMEGFLIDQHLGESVEFAVYDPEKAGSPPIARRAAPEASGGEDRWAALAGILPDCGLILASGAGVAPIKALGGAGIEVVLAEGLIAEALERLKSGAGLGAMMKRERTVCGRSCGGNGTGCG
jgi:nitrogen fixation protein NifB